MVGERNDPVLLSSLCVLINRGVAPAYTNDGGVLVLNQRCIRDGRINWALARYTDPAQKSLPHNKLLKPFDILVNSTGVGTLGRVAQIGVFDLQATVDSHVTIVRPDASRVDPVYLGLVLRDRQADIEALAEGSTGQTELSRFSLGALAVSLPPVPVQRVVASLLGSLDDKIELNQRIVATLEEMTQALFKSWFVDFDPVHAKAEGRDPVLPADTAALFPDRFGDDGLPEGWRRETLRPSLAQLVTRGITPTYADEGLAVINQKCIRNRRVDFALARWHDTTSRRVPDAKLLQAGDIVINSTGAGTLGRVAQVRQLGVEATVDTHVTIVRPSRDAAWSNYLGLQLISREDQIEQLGQGSTGQTELSRDAVASLSVVVPSDRVLDAFSDVTAPLLSHLDAALSESAVLRELRDTLLPKLISGELHIKDAEAAVEAA